MYRPSHALVRVYPTPTHRLFLYFLAWIAILLFAPGFARAETDRIPGEIIVQFEPGKRPADMLAPYAEANLQPARLLSGRMNIWLLSYEPAKLKTMSETGLLESIRRERDVTLAQFNHIIARRAVPNDPSFGQQWGLNNTGQSGGTVDADIDAPEAWDIATGGLTADGDEIVIAIIDGGFDLNHVDIQYWKNTFDAPGNGLDDDSNGYVDDYHGWNAYNNSGNLPGDNHGTHVAGIAGARGNNGTGVSGVNWGAKIMPIAGASQSEAIAVAAYSYAHELRATYNETNGARGAFVVSTNASFGVDFGNPANFPIWCAIYDSLGEVGILSAGATANLNINVDTQGDIPTACPSSYMISVTNTTRTDARNSGAAYGATTIDLGSPGTSVYSTLPGNTYGNLTGTSMATPHVAGAIALLYSAACPSLLAQYKADPATYALQFRQWLLSGTDPIAALSGITVTGGRLNIRNALQNVQSFACGVSISHSGLADVADTLNPYEATCTVTSEEPLDLSSLYLHYSAGGPYSSLLLSQFGPPTTYRAFIPAQTAGTTINYFFTAEDTAGTSDTTELFSFRVKDYEFSLTPTSGSGFGASFDTLWFTASVTNTGVRADSYAFTIFNGGWDKTLWDSSHTTPLSSSPMLVGNQSFPFAIRVLIPASTYGESDTARIVAVSSGNPALTDTISRITFSEGTPLFLPFGDSFTGASLDPTNWVQNSNATLTTTTPGIPSPPYAVNLDASPSGADTIVSQIIDLTSATNVALTYRFQRTGNGDSPEAGDDLFVEYRDQSGIWQVASQQPGSGPDMTDFDSVTVWLPQAAVSGTFKIRIRTIGSSGDDWFVDNVELASIVPPDILAASSGLSKVLAVNDSATGRIIISNTGQATLGYDASVIPAPNRSAAFEALRATGRVAPPSREYPDAVYATDLPKGQDIIYSAVRRVSRDAGGPDAFGYYWIDSDEPSGPDFDWVDISTTGTNVVAQLDDDNVSAPIAIGFPFPFYGNIHSDVYIGSNGLIGFTPDNMSTRFKTPLPTATTPNNIIAWLWDDLNPDDATNPGAAVFVQNLGNTFVIQFQNYPEYQAGAGDVVTAQIILESDGGILIQYRSLAAGFDRNNCAIGIENSDGTDGLEVAYVTPYLKDSLAVRIYQPYQWLTLSELSGTVPAGQSDTIVATFISAGLAEGAYEASVKIVSNDPDGFENPVTFNSNLTVTSTPFFCGDVNGSGAAPTVADLTYLINYLFNGGPAPVIMQAADVNGSGAVTVADLTFLVNFLFNGGTPPQCN